MSRFSPNRIITMVVLVATGVLLPFPSGHQLRAQVPLDWTRLHPGAGGMNVSLKVAVDSSGNVYVTGTSQDEEFYDGAMTVSYSATGDLRWASYFPRLLVRDLEWDRNDHLVIVGIGGVGGGGEIRTVSYTLDGDTAWARGYSGFSQRVSDGAVIGGTSIVIDTARCIYVTGSSDTDGTRDAIAIKYSESGTPLWTHRLMRAQPQIGASIDVDVHARAIVAGSSVEGSWSDFLTIRYSATGDTLWTRTYDGVAHENDNARVVGYGSDGSVYVAGDSRSLTSADNILTVKYDSAGALQWVRTIEGTAPSNDQVSDLVVSKKSAICVAGFVSNFGTSRDGLIAKYDESGTLLWRRSFNAAAAGIDQFTSLAVDTFGNVYAAGFTSGGTGLGGYDLLSVCYDSLGDLLWSRTIDIEEYTSDVAFDVTVTDDRVYVLTGNGNSQFCTARYSICDCHCYADPYCDGVRSDLLDVTEVIDVAFRAIASSQISDCPASLTDVDCSGETDVVDVVKSIMVALRSGSIESIYCNPCYCNVFPSDCRN